MSLDWQTITGSDTVSVRAPQVFTPEENRPSLRSCLFLFNKWDLFTHRAPAGSRLIPAAS